MESVRYTRLAGIVREGMEITGVGAAELARRTGRDRAWVSRVTRGETGASVEALRQLADAVGLSAEDVARAVLADIDAHGVEVAARVVGDAP
jgi:transcriptional regulator with XRE-family HTH domain